MHWSLVTVEMFLVSILMFVMGLFCRWAVGRRGLFPLPKSLESGRYEIHMKRRTMIPDMLFALSSLALVPTTLTVGLDKDFGSKWLPGFCSLVYLAITVYLWCRVIVSSRG